LLAPVLLLYTPWLLRNYLVSGNPAGIAFYAFFGWLGASEAGQMRDLAFDWLSLNAGLLRAKINDNILAQTGEIFRYFGWSMVVYGVEEEQGVAANHLHLLFLPIMTCFGLAFLLVQWNRLGITGRLPRLGFLTLLFVLCVWPMISNLLLASAKGSVRWPPYAPPYIAVIHTWMKPDEIIATDMPWAVAWYAERRAVWLPDTISHYNELNDYKVLGGPIKGIYLTPISGGQNRLHDILKGEYKDWAAVVLRSVNLQKFPLQWGALLGPETECVFFSDYDRQKSSGESAK